MAQQVLHLFSGSKRNQALTEVARMPKSYYVMPLLKINLGLAGLTEFPFMAKFTVGGIKDKK
jgi:hypothetical protein